MTATGAGAAWPTTLLLLAGAVGAVGFVATFLIAGATRTGYDPARYPVSALSLGERGWVQAASFVVTGALMGAFALGVRRALPDGPGGSWVALLLALFALALVASGVFAMDPPAGFPPGTDAHRGTASWHGIVHGVAGLVVFASLSAAAVVFAPAVRRTADLSWLAAPSVVAGTLCAGLFVAFAVADERSSAVAGLWQRASILTGWGWIALVAVALAASPAQAGQ